MTPWKRDIEIYSYEILWDASQSALKMAEIGDERIRPDHLAIHSLLTGFFAFEGFLNFVGEEIAEEAWAEERKFFSSSKYRGIIGKVEYLFSKFPDVELDKNSECYLTFKDLKDIRDRLAHNRVNRYREVSGSDYPSFKTYWEGFDAPEKVKLLLERLKEFAEIIRIEAVKLLVEDYPISHLHFPVFSGPIGHAEGKRKSGPNSN
jgi:hypothetical protein